MMKAATLWLLALVGSLATAWALTAAFLFSAEAVEGRVTDGAGAPLEGAVVTAYWELVGGFETGTPRGYIQILEAMTDAHGRYRLPSWGPRFSAAGHASSRFPGILIFKPGYRYLSLHNGTRSGSEFTTGSRWNGTSVQLVVFPDLPRYANEFDSLNRDIDLIGAHTVDKCAWRSMPLMIRALAKEEQRLASLGVAGFRSVAQNLRINEDYYVKQGCGSARAFLS